MSSKNLTIFEDQNAVVSTKRSGALTALGQQVKDNQGIGTTRRVALNANHTFKRMVNGEPVGNPVSGEINIIVVNALPTVSRTYYAAAYDPNAQKTLPDCWSNLGDVPDENASNPQNKICATCTQNVKGSGSADKRACRFNRRLAVMLMGDPDGEVYQMSIPAASLFGKGDGNTHPFESYSKFLIAHNESPDTVVTRVCYNTSSPTMEVNFKPVRNLTDAEFDMVLEAQQSQEAQDYVRLQVAQTDKVAKKPTKPVVQEVQDEPDDEEEDDDAPTAAQVAQNAKDVADSKAAEANSGFFESAEPDAEPTVKKKAKKEAPPAKARDLTQVLKDWGEEES